VTCAGGKPVGDRLPEYEPDVTEAVSMPARQSRTRHLTRSYLLGLGVIAALGVTSMAVTITRANQARSSAQRMNLAGRQRLLTQRLVSAAYRLASARQAAAGSVAANETHADVDLPSAVANWRDAFERLRHGAPEQGLNAANANELAVLTAMTAHRQLLERRAASLAASVLSAPQTLSMADSLSVSADTVVAALDRYTALLVAQHHATVTNTQRIGTAFCALLLLLLALEAQFVFRPATRAIDTLLRNQDAAKVELSAKADEMYRNNLQQEIQNDTLQAQQHQMLDQQEELLAQQQTLVEQRDHLEHRTSDLSRLTAILDATPDAVAVFSLTGDVLYTNAAAEQLLAHARRRNWTHAAHLLTRQSVRQLRDVAFPRAIRRGLWQGESSLRTRGGPARTVVQTLLAHRGGDGRVATISVMLQDITEQKLLQERLAEGESRNRAIIEALAEGVVVQNSAGQIIAWNSSAERILGLSADELSGRTSLDPNWHAIDARGDALPGDQHPISRARASGESIDGEVMGVQHGDGRRVWLSVNARSMLHAADVNAPAAVATFSDITNDRLVAHELETLSVVARQSDHAISTTDTTGALTWVNPAWERLTGIPLADALGKRPGELLQGTHTNSETVAQMRLAVRNAASWSGEVLNYTRSGTPFWIEMSITPALDAMGAVTGFVGLSRDITSRRNADRERQQLAAAVAVTADGIAITGVSGALEFVNHAFARMHGRKASELLQTPWSSLYDEAESQRLVQHAIPEVTQVGFWHGEASGLLHDGSTYPQDLSLTLLPHGGLVAVTRDISERKAAEERLLRLSVRDELTSLYNRRGFLEQSENVLRLSARQGVPCALLYGDLDSFKSVNDCFGHDVGDSALKTTAWILTNTFRETDLVARLGGDEFTILAIDVRPPDIALILERIDQAMARSNTARAVDPGQAWHLGISLGVAYFDPQKPVDVESLLRSADSAQYDTKRARKAAAGGRVLARN
jgi:diguanylate cyclase (GGDEF)-like protein/PAS domain S-box-containing protein